MMRLILTGFLIVILTACSTIGVEPNKQLVQQALALQLSQTQQLLSQQLQFSTPPKFEINRLAIKERQPLKIGNLPTYRVQGTYNLTIKLPKRRLTQKNSFEVYIQRQKEGKTWRLVVPESDSKNPNSDWRTYLIKPFG